MKNLIIITTLLCSIFLISSCNKEDTALLQKNESSAQFSFIYNGKTYSSIYEELDNGELILLDEKINTLRNRLLDIPELITICNNDGIVEYIENEEIAYKRLEEGTLFKTNIPTRAVPPFTFITSQKLILYHNVNYGDPSRTYNNPARDPKLFNGPMYFSIKSFKLSITFKTFDRNTIPAGPLQNAAYVRLYTMENYKGKQYWWKVDYDKQTQNITSIPKEAINKINSFEFQLAP